MKKLEPIGMTGANFNVVDTEKFNLAIRLLKESLFDGGATLFCSDNLITWNRNYSFLRDQFFIDIIRANKSSVIEKSIVWRSYIVVYFARLLSRVEGDFLELGCHTGNTASLILSKIKFPELNKKYFLYSMFKFSSEFTSMSI